MRWRRGIRAQPTPSDQFVPPTLHLDGPMSGSQVIDTPGLPECYDPPPASLWPPRGQAIYPRSGPPPTHTKPPQPPPGGSGVTPPPRAELLTDAEHHALELTAELTGLFAEIVAVGPSRGGDLSEFTAHLHAIQHAVLAQAAARAYPTRYRQLGSRVLLPHEAEAEA
jgi:hypothetical protein